MNLKILLYSISWLY